MAMAESFCSMPRDVSGLPTTLRAWRGRYAPGKNGKPESIETTNVRPVPAPPTLELNMRPKPRHHHRSPVAVVTRIVNMLNAGRDINSAPNVRCVVGFDDVFA